MKDTRKLIERNLNIVGGGRYSNQETEQLIRSTFQNYGRYLLDYMVMHRIKDDNKHKCMEEKEIGEENFKRAMDMGRGVICITPHLGNWDLGGIALLWRRGCIIRSAFLARIKDAYERNPRLSNLLMDRHFRRHLERSQQAWRRVVSTSIMHGVWIPGLSTALCYYDGYRNPRLPANLLQAQRDFFGAHQYERIDRPRGQFFHTNWTGRGGDTVSSSH